MTLNIIYKYWSSSWSIFEISTCYLIPRMYSDLNKQTKKYKSKLACIGLMNAQCAVMCTTSSNKLTILSDIDVKN